MFLFTRQRPLAAKSVLTGERGMFLELQNIIGRRAGWMNEPIKCRTVTVCYLFPTYHGHDLYMTLKLH